MKCVLLLLALFAQDTKDRDKIFQEDIAEAIKKLDSARYTESQAAREELIDIGWRATEPLVKALQAKDPKKPSVRLRRSI